MKSMLAIIFLFVVSPLSAQEKEQAENNSKTSSTAANNEAKVNKSKRKSSSDNYKASEEISEDLSVSFPVDI
ncbi:hypothetical protein MO867_02595 [Microbulbifer sp. OS29]|uniref:Uncharacterized protein n=1 Tax=Microbulbifer okhotskensis TaxID=2926617 RepID=A0A9X2EKF3_9GAMM|nr:hypothetical protein [Microbulbifer okhotskensis]MCO1333220.1 hypothetical protein [Microbulbifer okhotskensis]